MRQRFRLHRAGGFAGVDVVLLFLFYFNSGLQVGIKEFCRRAAAVGHRLAALAGRLVLPTQSSMSRCLAAVEHSQVRPFAAWLLLEGCGAREVLRHPATMARDCRGGTWSFFDYDPTVTAVRQRGLPEHDDLPEASRRAAQAKPGYSGRKRGDVQFRRCALQHAGSGLWLAGEIHAGNGGTLESWKRALQQVAQTCRYAELPLEQAIIRSDGECGYVPYLHECIEAGVHYVSRSSAYHILNDPTVRRHLDDALWEQVPSSGSGPRRYATEVGEVTLTASSATKQAHGVDYPPVSPRVVVSRFETESKRGTGTVRNGWQYELYVTDLSLESWPAADLVWAYYGRIGQENRFYQEDRELDLDRTYSQNLAGQELAVTMGLFVWNLQLCRGFALSAAADAALPAQMPRHSEAVTLAPLQAAAESSDASGAALQHSEQTRSSQREEVVAASVHETSPAVPETPMPVQAPRQLVLVAPPQAATGRPQGSRAFAPMKAPAASSPVEVATSSVDEFREEVVEALRDIGWMSVLERLGPGWSQHPNGLSLVCPSNVELPIMCVENSSRRHKAHFSAPSNVCGECPHLDTCSRSATPNFRKQVSSPPLSLEAATQLKNRLARLRKAERQQAREDQRVVPLPNAGSTSPPSKPVRWLPHHLSIEQPFSPSPPLLLPANLRKIFTRACEETELEIQARLWARRRSNPLKVVANSDADRQHRRLTYADRDRWNTLPTHAVVHMTIEAPPALAKMLKGGTLYSRKPAA